MTSNVMESRLMNSLEKYRFVKDTKRGMDFVLSNTLTGTHCNDGSVYLNENGLFQYVFASIEDFALSHFSNAHVPHLASSYVGQIDDEGNMAWCDEEYSLSELTMVDGSCLYTKYALITHDNDIETGADVIATLEALIVPLNAPSTQQLPLHVQADIDSGYTITDIDDGFQRVKVKGSQYTFKTEQGSDTVELTFDIDEIDHEKAIDGYYDSLDSVKEVYGTDALLIIAECYFEQYIL